jgi:hypothetical protein
MRPILILLASVTGLFSIVHCPAQVVVQSSMRVRETPSGETVVAKSRYKCENGRCVLLPPAASHVAPHLTDEDYPDHEWLKSKPAASHSLSVPTKVERPVSQQPTPAEPQAACHTGYSSPQPVRSVAKAPLRVVGKLLSRVRDRKPLRSLAGWVFCR